MTDRQEENERLLAGIRSWVEIESPSTNAEAVNRMADMVEGQLDAIGLETERIPGRDGFGDHLLARTPWQTNKPGIMVLGHLDTVWSLGTLAARPFRIEDGKAYGPGIYDMKGGMAAAADHRRYLELAKKTARRTKQEAKELQRLRAQIR